MRVAVFAFTALLLMAWGVAEAKKPSSGTIGAQNVCPPNDSGFKVCSSMCQDESNMRQSRCHNQAGGTPQSEQNCINNDVQQTHNCQNNCLAKCRAVNGPSR